MSMARSPASGGWGTLVAIVTMWAMVGAAGCAGPNLWTDLGSVSTGKTNDGYVRKPARIGLRGPGWVVPAKWRARRFQFGTDEMVEAIKHVAGRVRARDRRAKLGVADLSRLTGGPSIWHGSHHSGRDVDLLFYTTDERGKPMSPPTQDMVRFDGDGKPFLGPKDDVHPDPDWASRRFDTKRNWQLVEEFLTDPSIRVQWIFVSNDLRARLLRYARRKKRPRWIVEYARLVMRQPGDASPHDDHFHVRIFCSRTDRFHGCRDRGPYWQHEKKTYKYYGPERYDPVTWRLLLGTPHPLL